MTVRQLIDVLDGVKNKSIDVMVRDDEMEYLGDLRLVRIETNSAGEVYVDLVAVRG